jgi:hypothetical protein
VPAGLVEAGAAAARLARWDRHVERKVN